jgi:hypothetical protein
MQIHMLRWTIALALAACGSSQPAAQNPPAAEPVPGTTDRKALAQTECEAQGGSVVGDIGDGATQRADYVCPSGKPPLGNIAPPAGGPMPIEGAVCCPQ